MKPREINLEDLYSFLSLPIASPIEVQIKCYSGEGNYSMPLEIQSFSATNESLTLGYKNDIFVELRCEDILAIRFSHLTRIGNKSGMEFIIESKKGIAHV